MSSGTHVDRCYRPNRDLVLSLAIDRADDSCVGKNAQAVLVHVLTAVVPLIR